MDTAKLVSAAESAAEDNQMSSAFSWAISEQLREISTYLYLDSRRYDSNIDGGFI